MPKFGLNLLLWSSSIDDSHLPLMEQIKAWGYDGVEIPLFEFEELKLRRASRQLDDIGLERTTLTVCGAADNPISSDATVRRKGIDWLKRAVDASAAVGSHLLCGPLHSALGEFTGRGPSKDEWKWGQESLLEVADHARDLDVVLAVEAVNRFECYFLNCAADCRRFVSEMAHTCIGTMYDTFHAHIEEKDIPAAIKAIGESLVHVHISENDRSTPGRGTVDWQGTFRTLREVEYDGWLMIEAFGLVLAELAAATKIWRKMYESEEQLAIDGLRFMQDAWWKVDQKFA